MNEISKRAFFKWYGDAGLNGGKLTPEELGLSSDPVLLHYSKSVSSAPGNSHTLKALVSL